MMGYGGYGMMGFGLGWLMMIGLVALVVLGIFALTRYLKQQPGGTVGHSAMDILNERYARGEINEEEYVKMKSQLTK